jgi:hypothetical protein
MDTYHLNNIAQCDLLLLHDAISMLVWTSSIGAEVSVCRIPQSYRGRRRIHERLDRTRSALCSHYILSVSLFHRLVMTMFISPKSPCTEDSRKALSCGDWEIPPAFPRSLQETQPETHLNSSYVGFFLRFRSQMSQITSSGWTKENRICKKDYYWVRKMN